MGISKYIGQQVETPTGGRALVGGISEATGLPIRETLLSRPPTQEEIFERGRVEVDVGVKILNLMNQQDLEVWRDLLEKAANGLITIYFRSRPEWNEDKSQLMQLVEWGQPVLNVLNSDLPRGSR